MNNISDHVYRLTYDARQKLARYLLDTELGKSIIAEWFFREHIQRAQALGALVYCVYHGCDTRNCPDDGTHVDGDEDEAQVN